MLRFIGKPLVRQIHCPACMLVDAVGSKEYCEKQFCWEGVLNVVCQISLVL